MQIYNSINVAELSLEPTRDELALVTIDYIRHKADYNRKLGEILAKTPNEAYVSRNASPAANKKAIIETFESTVFSRVWEMMPARYQKIRDDLKPYQRNIAGLCAYVGPNNEDFQKVLANMESVAAIGCNIFPEPIPAWDSITEDLDLATLFVDEGSMLVDPDEPVVHTRKPDLDEVCTAFDEEEVDSPLDEIHVLQCE